MDKQILVRLMYIYSVLQCFVAMNEKILGTLANLVGFLLCCYLAIKSYDGNKNFKQCSILFICSMYAIFQCIYIVINGNFEFYAISQGVKILVLIYLAIYISIYRLSLNFIKNYLRFINSCIYISIGLCYLLTRRFSYNSYYGGNEFFGYISNPHSIGLGLIIITIYLVFKVISNQFEVKDVIYIVFNTALILALNVRTYQVAFIISISMIVLLTNKKKFLWKLKITSIALITIMVLIGINTELNIVDMREINEGNDGVKTIQSISSGRSVFWREYCSYIVNQEPMLIGFGNGLGSTLGIMTNLGFKIGAHNDFLQIIGEYGMIGIIIYILFILCLIKKVLKSKNYEYGLAIISAWIISAFINGSIYYTFSMILMIIGLSDSMNNNSEKLDNY